MNAVVVVFQRSWLPEIPVARPPLRIRRTSRPATVAGAAATVIDGNRVPHRPAEQSPHRLPHELAKNVPQRQVDRRDGSQLGAFAAECCRPLVKKPPVAFDGRCRRAEQPPGHPIVNQGGHRLWCIVAFAVTDHRRAVHRASIGVNAEQHQPGHDVVGRQRLDSRNPRTIAVGMFLRRTAGARIHGVQDSKHNKHGERHKPGKLHFVQRRIILTTPGFRKSLTVRQSITWLPISTLGACACACCGLKDRSGGPENNASRRRRAASAR